MVKEISVQELKRLYPVEWKHLEIRGISKELLSDDRYVVLVDDERGIEIGYKNDPWLFRSAPAR